MLIKQWYWDTLGNARDDDDGDQSNETDIESNYVNIISITITINENVMMLNAEPI